MNLFFIKLGRETGLRQLKLFAWIRRCELPVVCVDNSKIENAKLLNVASTFATVAKLT